MADRRVHGADVAAGEFQGEAAAQAPAKWLQRHVHNAPALQAAVPIGPTLGLFRGAGVIQGGFMGGDAASCVAVRLREQRHGHLAGFLEVARHPQHARRQRDYQLDAVYGGDRGGDGDGHMGGHLARVQALHDLPCQPLRPFCRSLSCGLNLRVQAAAAVVAAAGNCAAAAAAANVPRVLPQHWNACSQVPWLTHPRRRPTSDLGARSRGTRLRSQGVTACTAPMRRSGGHFRVQLSGSQCRHHESHRC
mmetsp:Transcript_5158/g.14826  ORF Transcript_5158/g.14826 Transcript_5158/m.14826 type:complete len:249 (-) Transcript_5158:202-948(-)